MCSHLWRAHAPLKRTSCLIRCRVMGGKRICRGRSCSGGSEACAAGNGSGGCRSILLTNSVFSRYCHKVCAHTRMKWIRFRVGLRLRQMIQSERDFSTFDSKFVVFFKLPCVTMPRFLVQIALLGAQLSQRPPCSCNSTAPNSPSAMLNSIVVNIS